MTPGLDELVAAVAFFGNQLVAVGDTQWGDPTPCPDWNVKALVSHVVVQDSQVREVLEGGRVDGVIETDETILGPDPVVVWRGTALAAIDAFRAEGVLDRNFLHPLGEVSGRILLGFRVVENLVHGWDLATACDRPVTIDDALADAALEFAAPLASGMRASGHFGDVPEISPDAPAGARLLAFTGRR